MARSGAGERVSRPLGAGRQAGRRRAAGYNCTASAAPNAGCRGRPALACRRRSPRPAPPRRPRAPHPELSRVPATAARPRPGPPGARRRHGVHAADRSAPTGTTVGEVVFNTAMTGYQEILTDPSYCRPDRHADLSAHRQLRRQRRGRRVARGSTPPAWSIKRPAARWRRTSAATATLARLPARARTRSAIADIDTRRLTRLLRSERRAERLHRRARARRERDRRRRRRGDRAGARGAVHGRASTWPRS